MGFMKKHELELLLEVAKNLLRETEEGQAEIILSTIRKVLAELK
jgi:flagellar biosynthesis/type III secretory pathway protein FliH